MRSKKSVLAAVIALALAAGAIGCGTCPTGKVDCLGGCIDGLSPTAASVQEGVFAPSCAFSACHAATAPKEALDLSTLDATFASAVGVPSKQRPELSRIAPGQPDASYLVNKLTGEQLAAHASNGDASLQMPPGAPLCKAQLDAVTGWIAAGAAR